jgi:hypothetical protein
MDQEVFQTFAKQIETLQKSYIDHRLETYLQTFPSEETLLQILKSRKIGSVPALEKGKCYVLLQHTETNYKQTPYKNINYPDTYIGEYKGITKKEDAFSNYKYILHFSKKNVSYDTEYDSGKKLFTESSCRTATQWLSGKMPQHEMVLSAHRPQIFIDIFGENGTADNKESLSAAWTAYATQKGWFTPEQIRRREERKQELAASKGKPHAWQHMNDLQGVGSQGPPAGGIGTGSAMNLVLHRGQTFPNKKRHSRKARKQTRKTRRSRLSKA